MEQGNSAVFGHRALDGWRGRDVHAPSADGLLCKAGDVIFSADGLLCKTGEVIFSEDGLLCKAGEVIFSAGGLLCKAGEIYLCADGLRGGKGKEKGGDIWRFNKILLILQEDEKGKWKVNSGVTRWKKN